MIRILAEIISRKVHALQRRRQVDAIARKHRPGISRFFRSQKKIVLEELNKHKHLFAESYKIIVEDVTQFTVNNFDLIWAQIEADTTPELQRLITQIEADALVKGSGMAAKTVGKAGFSFDLANPRAVEWFSQHAGSTQYIGGIQRTTQNQIANIIKGAIDSGQSYGKTATQISQRFDGFSRQRAQLIATHESAQAYEAGSYLAESQMVDDGIVLEKKWENSQDEKVSDGCKENTAAGWIPFNQPFPSGQQHPPRFVQCRCYHIVREKK